VVQLKTLEALCEMLIDAKVSEIASVRRRVFEQGAASQETPSGDAGRFGRWGPGGGGPAPEANPAEATQTEVVDPSGLFSIEHYTVEFKCHEKSVWDILNALAKSKLFTVVTSVSVANDNPVPKIVAKAAAPTAPGTMPFVPGTSAAVPGAPTSQAAGQIPEVKTQEERVIAGREFVKVVLDVDVYRFLGGEAKL
jgi:hypothetical protein